MKLEVVSREPEGIAHATPILFVHGMFCASWLWDVHFLPYFAERGCACCAVSLRGHGGSPGRDRLRWTSLAEYVADVTQIANQLTPPPVVVGHSMGGMIVQKYLEDHMAPAAVLLASGPPKGLWGATIRTARRMPLAFLRGNLTLSLFPLIGTPERCRQSLFSEHLPESALLAYHARFQDESFRAYVDMLGLNLPRPERVKTPMLVLGVQDDNMISRAEVEATAAAYHTEAEFFGEMGHALMLDMGWEAVAGRIAEWMRERE